MSQVPKCFPASVPFNWCNNALQLPLSLHSHLHFREIGLISEIAIVSLRNARSNTPLHPILRFEGCSSLFQEEVRSRRIAILLLTKCMYKLSTALEKDFVEAAIAGCEML